MPNNLEPFDSPVLPVSANEYVRTIQDQEKNLLRLFFNRITSTIRTLTSKSDGGKYLYFPRGLFYDTNAQTAALVNTGYPISYGSTYIGNGVAIENNSQVHVSADGMYNFQLTVQVDHTNSSDAILWVWINKSGTDVTYGGQEHTVKGNALQVVHWNFSIDLAADDYIEMYWATDDTALTLHSHAPTTPHPGVPSVVLAVSFVSNL